MAIAPVIKDRTDPPLVRALTAGGLYFLVAFGFGFAFGAVRELVVTPRLGVDLAIVIETPLMAIVAWFAARFSVGQCAVPRGVFYRLAMGLLALGLLIGVEELLTRALRGGSLFELWATFGVLATVANLAGLAWFTFAPILAGTPPVKQIDPHA